MIVLRKFCPNFAHSVRKKIIVSSNIIPQGIDGVISAYYKVYKYETNKNLLLKYIKVFKYETTKNLVTLALFKPLKDP